MHIHAQDEETLRRILGLTEVPADVAAEYGVRIEMFHRGGDSGPLKTLGLIDLVRSLGYKRKPVDVVVEKVDWRQYPGNGTVLVEALYSGAWQPGVYLGPIEGGTLAVRLDGDPMVKECRAHMLRLAVTDTVSGSEKHEAGVEEPSARAKLLEKSDAKPAQKPKEPEKPADPPAAPVVEDEGEDEEESPSLFAEGDAVWVKTADDVVDGTFMEFAEPKDGEIRMVVEINGELEEFSAEAVRLAD